MIRRVLIAVLFVSLLIPGCRKVSRPSPSRGLSGVAETCIYTYAGRMAEAWEREAKNPSPDSDEAIYKAARAAIDEAVKPLQVALQERVGEMSGPFDETKARAAFAEVAKGFRRAAK